MKKHPGPNLPLKIAALFLAIDFFAFQKPLPSFVGWLLIVIPLVLLAATCFLWAYHGEFPFFRNPIFPYINFSDDFNKVLIAILLGLAFTLLSIIVTVSYFFG